MKQSPRILAMALALFSVNSYAQSDGEYYLRLTMMQKFARAQKVHALLALDANDPASALSRLGLLRHVFAVGQHWTVQVTPKVDSRGRPPISSAEPLPAAEPERVLYDFKVLSVVPGSNARVEVRERAATSEALSSRVDHIVLTLNEQFVVRAKEIHHVNRPAHSSVRQGATAPVDRTSTIERQGATAPVDRTTTIEFGGEANVALGFEAYPIDLPDLGSAENEPLRDIPKAVAKHLPVAPEHILDFHFNDLFARPVRALWAEGDVWPLYYENTAFTAILISRGTGP